MVMDSYSHDLSDGKKSMQHFLGNLQSSRHYCAATPALAVADAALAWRLLSRAGLKGGEGDANLARMQDQYCLAKCALNCKCRYKQGTSKYKREYVQIQAGILADTNVTD